MIGIILRQGALSRLLAILHGAAAKVLAAGEFISTDTRQTKLATAMGLNLVTFQPAGLITKGPDEVSPDDICVAQKRFAWLAGFPHIPANMKSMTGYGRGECVQDGFKITVELSSVNRKQGEISVSLPRELEVLEAQVRNVINQKISRGRLNARINLQSSSDQAAGAIRPNLPLAKAYLRELKKLAKELKLDEAVTLDQVIRAPGVLQAEDKIADAEGFWPAVETALQQALTTLVKMREKEGAHLAADLKARVKIMREAVATVEKRAPEILTRYRDQLRERVKNAGVELPAEHDERLLKELVFFSDRSDISEELTRLASHFKQFDDYVKSKEPVGRTLDFLSQEINREINTIGSKANDSLISREVVVLKTELEKFREQVQNIE